MIGEEFIVFAFSGYKYSLQICDNHFGKFFFKMVKII